MDELVKIPELLHENRFVRQGSIQLWYQEFMETVQNDTTVGSAELVHMSSLLRGLGLTLHRPPGQWAWPPSPLDRAPL